LGRRHDARPGGRRARRPRTRRCLLEGCDARYRPAHWRTRYCSEACRASATRWLAARRQRRRRECEDARKKHRDAEKKRRDLAKEAREGGSAGGRGHAHVSLPEGPFCDRPGCYAPPMESRSRVARFCCAACRRAVQRVIDRERKWRVRATAAGRIKRGFEYERRRSRSDAMGSTSAEAYPPQP
jgi:hypothetical protein